jgi:hypothetical protein
MSIFNDDRRYSDNEEEYLQWEREVAWECRRDDYEPDDDLVVDLEEGDE